MSTLTITTNGIPRDIIKAYELADNEREQFDYYDWSAIEKGEDSASFFRYKGELYDFGEFMVWNYPFNQLNFKDWHGYQSDTYFSGIVIKYTDDFERVIVGRYYS